MFFCTLFTKVHKRILNGEIKTSRLEKFCSMPLAQLTVKTKFDIKIFPSDTNKLHYYDET